VHPRTSSRPSYSGYHRSVEYSRLLSRARKKEDSPDFDGRMTYSATCLRDPRRWWTTAKHMGEKQQKTLVNTDDENFG